MQSSCLERNFKSYFFKKKYRLRRDFPFSFFCGVWAHFNYFGHFYFTPETIAKGGVMAYNEKKDNGCVVNRNRLVFSSKNFGTNAMKNIFIALGLALSTSCAMPAQGEMFYTLMGNEVSLDAIESSPKAVVFLWTTWCPHCRKELSRLNQSDISYKDVSFYYVDIGESKSTVEGYAKSFNLKQSIKEKILLDRAGLLAAKYSVVGIPTFIFLKKGKLVYKSSYISKGILEEVFKND